ncbi:FAD-dependent oxidoreductase [Octadecabacter sp. 1_MG-2023]|uniref:NAD(P)/FAD-dependent oxidoreductase n=1 Tax=unclassified Octadecabacter TaxID=196158 RepID=UPI001C094456|nr:MULTISPECIES: FAD-dependent oxidoreductase [unclassified Octadecabacter]MBU2992562.1 FAD-binding oxidoreductase [Octadecabacter sp. B2R22]MDO6734681.1 FAD-dependent oxidoreductase [Octadecabacter sp. 1_MG-2023]
MATVDVTVRGAGAFGLSVAWACVKRGARVRIIDPNGVGSGSSGGIVGALAPHVPEQWNPKKAFQLESLLLAEEWWREVDNASGLSSGYGRTGRLQPLVVGANDLAQSRAIGADNLWQGRAIWEVIDAPQSEFAPISPTGLYIRDTLSGRIHPAQACASLAKALDARGCEIAEDSSFLDEGAVVWATGYRGLEALTADHTRLVGAGIKGQAVLLDYDARTEPQLFVDGLHIIPHADGTTAIGSTTEREFDDPESTDAQCDALVAKAREYVPALSEMTEIRRWAGVRPRARTRAPMLGNHPFRDGEFIANGGFKIGFGMAPLAAEKLAQFILTGENTIPEDFNPALSL